MAIIQTPDNVFDDSERHGNNWRRIHLRLEQKHNAERESLRRRHLSEVHDAYRLWRETKE